LATTDLKTMASLTSLLVYGLATWRVASLFVREDGPFFIFRRIRELAGMTHDENGQVVQIPDRFFAQLLSCVWCTSFWVALFWVTIWLTVPEISFVLAFLFALSTVSIMVDKVVEK
jgi:hypothetical protein